MFFNNKAQFDFPIIAFVILVVGLIIFAPVMLKTFKSIKEPLSSSFGNVSIGGTQAKEGFDSAMNPLINWWDKIIIFCFVVSIIMLLVSSFLIDTHPFFIILYIFICLMLVLFAPAIMKSADNIYDSSSFASETNQLSFMNELRNHFGIFLVGVIVITGIIMYGKINFFGSSRGGVR